MQNLNKKKDWHWYTYSW